jgi:hypothetical protein
MEENMRTINVSRPKDYYTQINNKKFPLASCNTTSMVEALVVSEIDFPYPDNKQPEDYFTEIMETEELYKMRDRYGKWAKNYRPAEIHMLLSWATNKKLVGRNVTRFSTEYPLQLLLFDIACRKRPVVMSGSFTSSGHIVVLVGFTTLQEEVDVVSEPKKIRLGSVKEFIVDDPYGNWYTDYSDHHGNDIRFSFPDFNRLTNRSGDMDHKWAHRIII